MRTRYFSRKERSFRKNELRQCGDDRSGGDLTDEQWLKLKFATETRWCCQAIEFLIYIFGDRLEYRRSQESINFV